MPKIITQAVVDALFTGFKANFQMAFDEVKPSWNKVAMEVPSSTSMETYGWLGQVPRMREWIGDRVIKGMDSYGYTIRNRTFETTIGVRREQIEDDQIGIFSPLMQELGRGAATFPDELVWPMLSAGFSTNAYDGQWFFDVDHPVRNAAGVDVAVSNFQGGSGTPWYLLDTTRAIKPLIYQTRRPFAFVSKDDPRTSDFVFNRSEYLYGTDGRCNAGYGLWQLAYASRQTLNQANFRAARQAMVSQFGDEGRPLGIVPNLLVVPPSLENIARDLLLAERGAGGATNTDFNMAQIHMSVWL